MNRLPPDPPKRTELDFPERERSELETAKPRKNLARTPTDEISLDDVRRELKARRATRWPKLITQILAALTALAIAITGLWKAVAAGATADATQMLADYKAEQDRIEHAKLKEKVADMEEKLNRLRGCCSWRER